MRLLILFSFLYPPLQKKDKVGLSKLLFFEAKIYFQDFGGLFTYVEQKVCAEIEK